jgi:hypothetical protein
MIGELPSFRFDDIKSDEISIDHLITEDDKPVDNIYSEKNERLLTEPLYSSKDKLFFEWPFIAAANVGIFEVPKNPAIVPDVFISLDVQVMPDWQDKKNRSYFTWVHGKVPEIAVEIVSNKVGDEDDRKMVRYANMGILYYVIFDPSHQLSDEILRMYQLDSQTGRYYPLSRAWFPKLGLGFSLWEGEFEGVFDVWLRWCDSEGEVIPTGEERAEQERLRAEHAERQAKQERHRAEQAERQAEQERHRAEYAERQAEQERQEKERLATKLRELGIDSFSSE